MGQQASVVLGDDVHGVVVGEDLALIDLGADAYLCLPNGACGVEPGGLSVRRLHGPTAAAIEAAGLGGGNGSAPFRPPPALPMRTVIHDAPSRVSPRQVLRGLCAVSDVRRALRGTGLRPILAVAPGPGGAVSPERVTREARAFWRLSPWLPIEGECLVRSAVLMSYLRRAGLSADWVFGVRLWPFSAHCWVQVGDVCLNDDIERLAAYTPIYCR
ncbi:lasso peptide biosynthesis B2 protein [Brevundimonas sp.]|jgi:hypothetical protein|uniref:lasso peptide biosynthesis B2 protein n=1 Tax=Brevundimonas sp. TaxID=1871086 RepID=UPI0037BFC3F6